jgi:ABC-2 type transport system permease protein
MADAPSFWSALIVDGLLFGLQAAVFWALYLRVDDVNGWDRWQAVFFVGTFTLMDGIWMTVFFFGLIRIPELVRTGKLDAHLARPVDTLLYVSLESIDPGSALLIAPALGLTAWAALASGARLSAGGLAAYAGAMAMMLWLVHSLMVLVRVPAFWFKRADVFQSIENTFMEMAIRVPGSAYRGVFKILFRLILPYGLIAAFPSEVFFGASSWRLWAASAAVTLAFGVVARAAWNLGLRHYGSSGS